MFARRDFRSAETGVGGRNASVISTSPPAPTIVAAGVVACTGVCAFGRRSSGVATVVATGSDAAHNRSSSTASVARSLTKGLLVACGSGAGDAAAGSGSGVGGAAGASGEFAAGAVSGVGSVICGVGSAFCGVGALGVSGFASGSK